MAELWESFTPEQIGPAVAAQDARNRRYTETGELLGAFGLSDEHTAKTVAVRDGVPAVSVGPYDKATEYIASFYILDVADEARPLELAAELPWASERAVEVWPILHDKDDNA
jgi:hypothetical protein